MNGYLLRSLIRGGRSFTILCGLVAGAVCALGQTSHTITLISGNGEIGQRDPANLFTLDGGSTFEEAYIIAAHPAYSVINGTQYINRNPDYSGPENTSTRYRTVFTLPIVFANPSLSIQIHADNVAKIWLNGSMVAQQPNSETFENFQDPPAEYTVDAPFKPGLNLLEFDIFNFSGPTAFDYRAVITFDSLELDIDIRPNSINPGSRGTVAVVVFSSPTFNAVAAIDQGSLRFGRTGTESSFEFCNGRPEDVNRDGFPDLMCHFNNEKTGFQPGDVYGVLTGMTVDGIPFWGTASIRTVPPKASVGVLARFR